PILTPNDTATHTPATLRSPRPHPQGREPTRPCSNKVALNRRYFETLALSTAGLAEHKTLYDAAQIDRKTAAAYDRLLENLLVLEILPAWTNNRFSRLMRTGKRYIVDVRWSLRRCNSTSWSCFVTVTCSGA
ncbi:MAG: DUF4143 domain-containing protein, partial [Solirubrobacteraceae bacterium]